LSTKVGNDFSEIEGLPRLPIPPPLRSRFLIHEQQNTVPPVTTPQVTTTELIAKGALKDLESPALSDFDLHGNVRVSLLGAQPNIRLFLAGDVWLALHRIGAALRKT